MRFAHPWWLAGTGVALVVAVGLILGAFLLVRAGRRFGDEARVAALVTDRPAGRRALKGVLLVLAVAAGFVALAQPQYGRGTRLVPATNLDVVIVLDYSKSMYARDVTPSRTDRAKTEVGRLIADLPGARFGAVAFAGEPASFPLTSDGAAIAQFFRQMTPADMPVGGTAIARALELGLDLLRRDPVSTRHRRVMVLVTDGEDLEGDPVSVAESAAKERVTLHVVQIGGRTPEPLPEVDDNGNVVGWRKTDDGEPMTTSLSSAGEEQLAKIAQVTGGNVVRSERGATGIGEITAAMRKMMTEELSEQVETVYADVYLYPTALAVLLLLLEAFVPLVRRRRAPARGRVAASAAAALILSLGCENGLFIRHSPVVDDALKELDAGDPGSAVGILQGYLKTGECKNGDLQISDFVREKPQASVDLGLTLFRIAERFGARFGDDKKGAAAPEETDVEKRRSAEVDCALRVVRVVAADSSLPAPLRAQAEYLTGNLEFLRGAYEAAVPAYDAALKLSPARQGDKEDSTGARAAWNRAIALRRIEEQKKPDASPPEDKPDGGTESADSGKPEQSPDGGSGKNDKDDQGKKDDPDKKDPGDQKDKKEPEKDSKDGQGKEPKPEDGKGSANPPPKAPSLSQDEMVLDELEQAPNVQQEAAKRKGARLRIRGLEDK